MSKIDEEFKKLPFNGKKTIFGVGFLLLGALLPELGELIPIKEIQPFIEKIAETLTTLGQIATGVGITHKIFKKKLL